MLCRVIAARRFYNCVIISNNNLDYIHNVEKPARDKHSIMPYLMV